MPSIKHDMIHGVFWSGVEKYSGLVVSIIVSAVLARILSPDEFGIVTIATVLIHFLAMFATMGIGPAIIQRNDLTQKDLNSIFTFSLLVGLGLSILFILASWPIATYYENEQLILVCQILSINLFFAAANMVPNALMAKNKRFKDIARRTLILQTISGFISIIAAYKGAGVYALLISPIFSSIGIYLYNRRFYPCKVDRYFTLEPIKRIFAFSSYQFLFEFVNYFSRNLDKLIIGRYMNMADLGYYEKGYRLMQLPLHNITSVINPVMQPVLNPLQNNRTDLCQKYNRIIKFLATISFPLGITMACCSYEIINIIYGSNWNGAVPVFKILALSLPFQMILSTSGSIFLVCNNTKAQFWVGIRNTVITVSGFIIATFCWKSITSIAWAWTITLFVNFAFSFNTLYHKVIGESILPMIKVLICPLINAILLYLVLEFINSVSSYLNIYYLFSLKCFLSLVITLLIIQFAQQYDIISFIKSKLYNK